MANFSINNFVIDHAVRANMVNTDTGEIMWSINQITNPKLTCGSETTEAKDALGTTIMTFERSKTAEFSAENAVFDLGLLAAQMGTSKTYAGDGTKVIVPAFETIDVAGENVTLQHKPIEDIETIYVLNGDSTLGTAYASGASATADKFLYDASRKQITLPTSVKSGQIFVMYDYEADGLDSNGAMEIVNKSNEFPRAGKFVLEVLGADVCNPSKLVYAYIIFDSAKLTSEVDLAIETEMSQGFTVQAQQAFCSKDKKLFRIVIPQ